MSFEVLPIAGALGAEVRGADLSAPLADAGAAELLDVLYQHKVIFFRGQHLTPRQHVDLSAQLGPVFTDHPPYLNTVPGYEAIIELEGQDGGRADVWHSDISISPKPPMGSVLYMKRCPAYGGDTMWADMTKAYDALSDRMKHYLEGLTATHDVMQSVRAFLRDRDDMGGRDRASAIDPTAMPSAVHPVVRTHPVTGRRILYVNPTFTAHLDGVPPEEGEAVLDFLFAHQQRPEFQCRWRWQQGDLAIWDNRATHHYAIADYGDQARTIHRVTLEGEAPV